MEQDHQVCDIIKQNIMIQYMFHFRIKLVCRKKKVIEQFKGRKDYQNMSSVDNADQRSANLMLNKMFGNKGCDHHGGELDDSCQQIDLNIKGLKTCTKLTSTCLK